MARLAGCGRGTIYEVAALASRPFGTARDGVELAVTGRLVKAFGGCAVEWYPSAVEVVAAAGASADRRRKRSILLAHPHDSALRMDVDATRVVSEALVAVSNVLHRARRFSGRPRADRDRVHLLRDDGVDRAMIRALVQRRPADRFERLEMHSDGRWRWRLGTLRRAELGFVIVGDLAILLHGGARLPESLEICVGRGPEESRRLAALLVVWSARPAGVAELGLAFVRDMAAVERYERLTLDCRGDRVDIVRDVPGIGDAAAASRVAAILRLPEPVLVLQPEALIRSAHAEDSARADRRRMELAAVQLNRSRFGR
ncbi:MAG: hypothetical protein ACRELV_07190 [Longimicrobiales bacterium]